MYKIRNYLLHFPVWRPLRVVFVDLYCLLYLYFSSSIKIKYDILKEMFFFLHFFHYILIETLVEMVRK